MDAAKRIEASKKDGSEVILYSDGSWASMDAMLKQYMQDNPSWEAMRVLSPSGYMIGSARRWRDGTVTLM